MSETTRQDVNPAAGLGPTPEPAPSLDQDRDQPHRHWVRHGWGRWLWRNLTAMRTAVALLGLLALAAIPGSVLPQRGVSSDPAAVAGFTRDNPRLAPWLDALGLFNVYSAPWFAAIYLLLLVSMTGCVLPRCVKLWRAARADPPPAPRHLARMAEYDTWRHPDPAPAGSPRASHADLVLRTAAEELRRRRFRVAVTETEVRAEKGFTRELGNLVFHLSLLVLLFGVAVGRLWGFEGRVAVVEGAGFSNVTSQYDEFTPRALTDTDNLEPFSFTLDDFDATFETAPAKRGEPRSFAANVSYRPSPEADDARALVAPNKPLVVNGTKVFLTGHGYAPVVTVRDGRGETVFTGPVIFLPIDSSYASDGVVKAPDARPVQLGFEGFFLPTGAIGENGPFSAFPGPVNPQLFLTAWFGDLGMGQGEPQSVFTLEKRDLEQFRTATGQPFAKGLSPGDTMKLPNGRGSLTFESVSRFANFQIAHDPGKEVSLVAALLLLIGLTSSLTIRRRRIWVRVRQHDHNADDGGAPGGSGIGSSALHVECAGSPLTRRGAPADELSSLVKHLRGAGPRDSDERTAPRNTPKQTIQSTPGNHRDEPSKDGTT